MRYLVRVLVLILGISLMSTGVSLTVFSDLGTTPNSSLPVVLSAISGWTVGTFTIILNGVYILAQILLLRERYRWIQLLQFATGFLFGIVIDVSSLILRAFGIDPANYRERAVLAILGILAMGVGIGLQVWAKLINLPGEGFVLALTAELRRVFGPKGILQFGHLKTISDLSHAVLSLILSLIFLGEVVGVREATIISALTLGYIAQATLRVLPKAPKTAEVTEPS